MNNSQVKIEERKMVRAVSGILLFITAQLASAYEGNATLLIDQRKLKIVAVVIGMLFLVTMATLLYGIKTST